MGEKNYSKLFCALAFIAFASVSCWATAESLHLLLSSWPAFLCWIVTIGFFVIASWGSKMIADSFNTNVYLEKRGVHLISGIFIVLVFWGICSMPTNTHTFFYRNVIGDKVQNDVSTTKTYLIQIRDNTVTEKRIQEKCLDLENQVKVKLGELIAEIMNPANPGYGPRAKEILRESADLFGVVKIDELSGSWSTVQGRKKLCEGYKAKYYALLDIRKGVIRRNLTPPNNNHQKQAELDCKNLELIEQYVEDGTIDLNNTEDIKSVCDKLNAGYSTISNYKEFVDFKNEEEKMIYTAPNPITKVKRMLSVFDVWRDFLHGEYAGRGFSFWIIISILVDIAAFLFFDIAFKREND